MIKFYEVKNEMKKVEGETILPTRSTKSSAGYDFISKQDCVIPPKGIAKLWSDVKVQMDDDVVLLIDVRSSMGGRFRLTNTLGVVDADYFGNSKNDGNIGIFLENTSDETQYIHIGDKIAQGIFVKYLKTIDDDVQEERTGGFGSTGA